MSCRIVFLALLLASATTVWFAVPGSVATVSATASSASPSPPTFSFESNYKVVSERAGRATFVVDRAGNPRPAVTVGYRTSAVNNDDFATPGWDFVSVEGRLHFRAGQTTKKVSVRIVDDTQSEGWEGFLLLLHDPGPGAEMGFSYTARVIIRQSDIQPDLWIGPSPSRVYKRVPNGYLGNDVYNVTGRGQTLVKQASRDQVRHFFVRLYNDGSFRFGRFTLHAGPAPAGVRVRYLHGKEDLTRALRSTAGYTTFVSFPKEWAFDTWWPLRIDVTAPRGAPLGPARTWLRVTTHGDKPYHDVVGVAVRVAR